MTVIRKNLLIVGVETLLVKSNSVSLWWLNFCLGMIGKCFRAISFIEQICWSVFLQPLCSSIKTGLFVEHVLVQCIKIE